jgi:hypothetical protein
VTSERHELDELRERITTDASERARFIAGLDDALRERDVEALPTADLVAAAEAPDAETRRSAFAGVAATGAILFAAPAIASRVVLAQVGSEEPCLLLICLP